MLKFAQEIALTKNPKLGYVPSERLIESKRNTDQLLSKYSAQKATIAGVTWTDIGLYNVGGRTRGLLFDPADMTKSVFLPVQPQADYGETTI